MTLPEVATVRFLPARDVPIVQATDLGSVQVLKHGNRFLLTDSFGDIHPDSRGLGLYHGDTRTLSCSVLRVGGGRPVLLQTSVGGNYRGGIQMTNPAADRNPDMKVHPQLHDDLAGRTIGISRERVIGADGVEERLRIENHADQPSRVPVELELGFDGADIFEVRGYPRPARGRLLPVAVTEDRVTFRYDGLDGIQRLTHLAFTEPALEVAPVRRIRRGRVRQRRGGPPAVAPPTGRRRGPRAVLDLVVHGSAGAADLPRTRPRAAPTWPRSSRPLPRISGDEGAAAYHAWERGTTTVESDHELFNLVVKRSISDLRLLINDGPGPDQRYVAAGVPWFTTLFGRDALITAFQSLAFRPQLAVETLEVLAAYQATEDDPWRDAEPGKILHELRTGEMARAGELPHTPYYGSVDSTPLWLILLGATFDWTGDRALVDRLWPNALAALDWIERYGDKDGDGFIEYERRSERGLLNQGWKDSGDAIRDRTGRECKPPIALAEVQGYVFDAKRRMARLARMRGDEAMGDRLDREATELAARFEVAFWVEDQRYYAMALDADKRHADAIGSNAGQCLWSGIVSQERSGDVVERLLQGSMFSGWGIRTYASGQPGLQPDRLPHGDGLAARHLADRRGLQALRVRRGVEPPGRADDGGGAALPRLPPARAVLRLREGACRCAGVVSGRVLAAGLGRRRVVPVRRDDARAAGARGTGRARVAAPQPARLAAEREAHRPAGRRRLGRPAVPPLARHHQCGGPAQGRRRGRHDPALIGRAR